QPPAGQPASAADSASLADFGDEDVATEEAEIESGAPLEIPEVPAIPAIPADLGDGNLSAARVSAEETGTTSVPAQGTEAGRANSADEPGA
ncbi:MAG TPA: hypothetical protein VLW44_01010, partial [Streptosporangiaceae bacterium]|nr:hypothetical protein [Streptosporangiaceae bacterium]